MSTKKYANVQDIFEAIIKHYKLAGYGELAAFVAVPYQTLMAWKKRGRIGDYSVFLDKCIGLRLDWLKYGEGEMLVSSSMGTDQHIPPGVGDYPMGALERGQEYGLSGRYVRVPHYNLSASGGGGAFVESEQIVDYLMFDQSWIRNTLGISTNQLALIGVVGDSMSPTYNDGDLILVDTTSSRPRSDAVYVIQNSEFLWVKRLHFHFDGSIAVISDNPHYPEQTITGEALERLRIVGRVMWRGGK